MSNFLCDKCDAAIIEKHGRYVTELAQESVTKIMEIEKEIAAL